MSSIGFFAMAREEYRKEFRSIRFVRFVCGWLVINMAVFLVVLAYFGWLYLEQVPFYLTYAQIHGSRRSSLPNQVARGHPNGDALKARRS